MEVYKQWIIMQNNLIMPGKKFLFLIVQYKFKKTLEFYSQQN